ncbi:hypothetical protein BH11CYA1_BH11CYA1_36810 [soil metagenome]
MSERKAKICLKANRLKAKASLFLCLPLISIASAFEANAQSILPPRPEAINGGNPFEGLGRPDDPNPSRVGDFPELGGATADIPAANSDAPVDPNLNQITNPQPSTADTTGSPAGAAAGAGVGVGAAGAAADPAGGTPGAAEALLKAQQLAKEEGVIDPSQQKPGLFGPEAAADKPAANQNEASFFKVVPDSPIRGTLVDIREGRYEQALNQLKTMYERQPTAIELQYLMGVSAVMLHRNSEAVAHYQRVLDDKLAPLRLKQLAQKGLTKLQSR